VSNLLNPFCSQYNQCAGGVL